MKESRKKEWIYLVCGICAGALLGWLMNTGSKKQETPTPAKSADATGIKYKMISPLSSCVKNEGVIMDELKSFRPVIEKYISDVYKSNPGFRIAYYFRDLNNGIWLGV